MYYPTRHRILIGIICLIIGLTIILGVLLMLDLHRPWQWPWLFGVVWFLIIINGPILIILCIRFMILGYLDRYVFRIPSHPVYSGNIPDVPIQVKPQVRHCPHCKREIPIDSKFCSYCGDEV